MAAQKSPKSERKVLQTEKNPNFTLIYDLLWLKNVLWKDRCFRIYTEEMIQQRLHKKNKISDFKVVCTVQLTRLHQKISNEWQLKEKRKKSGEN